MDYWISKKQEMAQKASCLSAFNAGLEETVDDNFKLGSWMMFGLFLTDQNSNPLSLDTWLNTPLNEMLMLTAVKSSSWLLYYHEKITPFIPDMDYWKSAGMQVLYGMAPMLPK